MSDHAPMTAGVPASSTDDVAYLGGEAKALGDGRVGGYLVRFGVVDVQGDLFDAGADFGLDASTKAPIYYHHGVRRRGDRYSDLFRNRRIGAGEVKMLDDGLWIEGQIDLSRPGAADLYADVEAGRMGWSSGTSDRFVAWEPMQVEGKSRAGRRILAWPLNDASLTPTPVEARNRAITMKAIVEAEADEDGPTPSKATTVEPGAAPAPTLDEELLRLATDAERLRARSAEFAALRRDRDGRDLSRQRLDSFKAIEAAFGGLHREFSGAITPTVDRDEFRALLNRARQALKPARRT